MAPHFSPHHDATHSSSKYLANGPIAHHLIGPSCSRAFRFLFGLQCDFCIGVAGYPEKHFEAASLKFDVQNLKKKIDAGASYIVTQMFFENEKYFNFVKHCRDAGITVPIIPGLKVLKNASQLKSIPKNFYIDFPDALVEDISNSPQHVEEIGQRWAKAQVEQLLNAGVPGIHFYVLNDVHTVAKIVRSVK